ncbi:MAG: imidazoleglycerol-phosphate dehydratase HisB [Limnochordaceae bacterium]|nr:imidazoleglycerol-phosphate dehydratase HisB [Limnochordaceae bacterium]
MNGARQAEVERSTAETRIRVQLHLDGSGVSRVRTGIGFFDHMLASFAHHSLFDLTVEATGDLQVDGHHTVEDTGLVLGDALRRALGDWRGIVRFGDAAVPMDEALVLAAVDLSGRPLLSWEVPTLDAPGARLGEWDVQLAREFFGALASAGRFTLHVRELSGRNLHHVAEATFKAVARALREAVAVDPRRPSAIPSTKETLQA